MKYNLPSLDKNEGFVLVIVLVLLVLLSIMGIAITRVSYFEIQVAGNDRKMKHGFYKADGGTEAGIKLMEENLLCHTGFHAPGGFNNNNASNASFYQLGGIDVFDARFAHNTSIAQLAKDPTFTGTLTTGDIPSDQVRSLRIPDNPNNHSDSEHHVNLAIYGNPTSPIPGSSNLMGTGYDGGVGKSSGGRGTKRDMHVYSRYDGHAKTTSKLLLDYTYVIGSAGRCNY